MGLEWPGGMEVKLCPCLPFHLDFLSLYHYFSDLFLSRERDRMTPTDGRFQKIRS